METPIIHHPEDEDIRFSRILEAEKEKLRAEYEKKIEAAGKAKTDFLMNMSHDIRTPMNAIIGFTQMALRNVDDRYMVTDCLNKVRSASGFLLTLLNDVLDMAKIENGKLTLEEDEVILGELLADLEDMVQESAEEKQLKLTFDCEELNDDAVWADQLQLTRVFMNIISNAIKYTKPGGTVDVRLRQLTNEETLGVYEFTVKDSGIGMTEDFIQHIFEQFSRERNSTDSGIQGTGLGMAITKTLVDMMKGDIRIDSQLGAGTTVTVTLPLRCFRDYRDSRKSAAAQEHSRIRLDGMRVLLAEDNLLNREIAVDILGELGVMVDEAEDGAVAVEKIRSASPGHYHLVLMDIQMPYLNGYRATEIIRGLDDPVKSSLPIYALSANVFAEDKKKSAKAGMNGHLGKPFDMTELIRVLTAHAPKDAGAVRDDIVNFTAEAVPEEKTEDNKQYTVLITDDSEINRRFLRHILKEHYNVLEASNGQEALAILRSGEVPVHLIVLDLSMPIMTGFEFMQTWKDDPALSRIPVMVETAAAGNDGEITSLRLGASDFVKRPFQSEIILHRIANVIRNTYETAEK